MSDLPKDLPGEMEPVEPEPAEPEESEDEPTLPIDVGNAHVEGGDAA